MISKLQTPRQGMLLLSPLPLFYNCQVFFSQIAHTSSCIPFPLISQAKIFQGFFFFLETYQTCVAITKRIIKFCSILLKWKNLKNQTETANFRKIKISKIDHRENKQLEQNNYQRRILTFEKQCQNAPARKLKANAFHRVNLHNV